MLGGNPNVRCERRVNCLKVSWLKGKNDRYSIVFSQLEAVHVVSIREQRDINNKLLMAYLWHQLASFDCLSHLLKARALLGFVCTGVN